jgi:hypothetical protein
VIRFCIPKGVGAVQFTHRIAMRRSLEQAKDWGASMQKVKSVPLAKLKVYGDWAKAPLGSLLQGQETTGGEVVIGMRCELKLSGVPLACFLVLDGPNRGMLLEAGGVRGPALDVQGMVEIRVTDWALTPFTQDFFSLYGIVCEHVAGSGHLLVRATMRGNVRAFVWLRDPSGNEPTGTATTDAIPDLLIVGVTEVSELP